MGSKREFVRLKGGLMSSGVAGEMKIGICVGAGMSLKQGVLKLGYIMLQYILVTGAKVGHKSTPESAEFGSL